MTLHFREIQIKSGQKKQQTCGAAVLSLSFIALSCLASADKDVEPVRATTQYYEPDTMFISPKIPTK